MSAAIASCAARLISMGAGKSGKPCDKFTASYWMANRVISRITDSVNCAVLEESSGLMLAIRGEFDGFIFLATIQLAVNVSVARNYFNIFARLGERNRVHKFSEVPIRLTRGPQSHAVFASIVRGKRRFDTAEIIFQTRHIDGAQPYVVIRVCEERMRIFDFCFLGHLPRRLGQ